MVFERRKYFDSGFGNIFFIVYATFGILMLRLGNLVGALNIKVYLF